MWVLPLVIIVIGAVSPPVSETSAAGDTVIDDWGRAADGRYRNMEPIVEGNMKAIETLLPPPSVVSTAVLELAVAQQPTTKEEGLRLLKRVGVSAGTPASPEDRPSRLVAEPAGPWRTATSVLALSPGGSVSNSWFSLWFDSGPQDLMRGFSTVFETVRGAVGKPKHNEQRADGSRAVWWARSPASIGLYLHAKRQRARAGLQVGVVWSDLP